MTRCHYCDHQAPDRSAFCNTCGRPLTNEAAGMTRERRWIYIDLVDLQLDASLAYSDQDATAVAKLHERMAPFADDGWEWELHPTDERFEGWIYVADGDDIRIAGVRLLCGRDPSLRSWGIKAPQHNISMYRTLQLVDRPWTALPGSKVLARERPPRLYNTA